MGHAVRCQGRGRNSAGCTALRAAARPAHVLRAAARQVRPVPVDPIGAAALAGDERQARQPRPQKPMEPRRTAGACGVERARPRAGVAVRRRCAGGHGRLSRGAVGRLLLAAAHGRRSQSRLSRAAQERLDGRLHAEALRTRRGRPTRAGGVARHHPGPVAPGQDDRLFEGRRAGLRPARHPERAAPGAGARAGARARDDLVRPQAAVCGRGLMPRGRGQPLQPRLPAEAQGRPVLRRCVRG
eukprot:scaffold32072_cov61-Phaeocystis_antarctica.AAC.4